MGGGGAEKVTMQLANQFAANEIEVDLVLRWKRGPFLKFLDKRIELHALNGLLIRCGLVGKIIAFTMVLSRLKANTVLAIGEYPNVIVPISVKLMFSRKKVVISERSSRTFINSPELFKVSKTISRLSRLSYSLADRIICVSGAVHSSLLKTLPKVEEKCVVVNNPIDLDQVVDFTSEDVDHDWLVNKTVPVLLASGRLHISKDYVTMLKALREVLNLMEVRLIILGDGELKQSLVELCAKLGITPNVDFVGFQENPYKYLVKADLFVHSALFEGFPNVFLDALACGLHIVTTEVDAAREIISTPDIGVIVEKGNYQSLAAEIVVRLKKASDHTLSIERARDFDIERIADQYLYNLED